MKLLSGTAAKLCCRCKNQRLDILLPVVSSTFQADSRVRWSSGNRCSENEPHWEFIVRCLCAVQPNVPGPSDAARDLKLKQRSTSVEPKNRKVQRSA